MQATVVQLLAISPLRRSERCSVLPHLRDSGEARQAQGKQQFFDILCKSHYVGAFSYKERKFESSKTPTSIIFQITTGFSNWKDATVSFKKHAGSDTHKEAVDEVLKLPRVTKDIGEQLSSIHAAEKRKARDALRLIVSSVRYLARQAVAFRGAGSDESANLIQLLRLRGEDQPFILDWISKSAKKYTSPENQNEILQIMSHSVLRSVLEEVHTSPFLAVMVDETTDNANQEQLTFIIRWVSEDFTVSEEFLGLYFMSSITAQSIVDTMQDIFLRFQLPLSKLRGQCYDGCSTMAGAKGGVATKISELEPRALFTHCFGHALNLAVSDTIKNLPAMKDCLDTSFEVIKLVKFSPNREALLKELKEESGIDSPGLRSMCPTRWTVRANSLASIISNYARLMELWETARQRTRDTEMKARIQGVASQMQSFKFLFALVLSELILRHTDKLSQTLQQASLSSVEGHSIAMLTVKTLEQIRTDDSFALFWKKLACMKESLDVDDPQLPRKRKVPARLAQGTGPAYHPESPEKEFRRFYFEAIDLAVQSIKSRFEQKGFKMFSRVEQLLLKAAAGDDFSAELRNVCQFFGNDFDENELEADLLTLHQLYKSCTDEVPSLQSVKAAISSLSAAEQKLISSACRLFQLLLILPASNSTSERSFSALRRIKTFLRSTMTQGRLNHLMILHYHQDRTDQLDLKAICNEFVEKNDTRRSTFSKF